MFDHNKKGQLLGPNIALIAATIAVVIILIISFVLVRLIASPADDSQKAVLLQSQAITSLGAYLQTPINVSIDGKSQMMEMSNFIRLAKLNETYRGQLETITQEIFGKVYGENYGLEIPGVIKIYNKRPILNTAASTYSASITPDYLASARIPLPADIAVTLFLR
mgnify:CR=1 FL=1